jgi:hypothetical protein
MKRVTQAAGKIKQLCPLENGPIHSPMLEDTLIEIGGINTNQEVLYRVDLKSSIFANGDNQIGWLFFLQLAIAARMKHFHDHHSSSVNSSSHLKFQDLSYSGSKVFNEGPDMWFSADPRQNLVHLFCALASDSSFAIFAYTSNQEKCDLLNGFMINIEPTVALQSSGHELLASTDISSSIVEGKK